MSMKRWFCFAHKSHCDSSVVPVATYRCQFTRVAQVKCLKLGFRFIFFLRVGGFRDHTKNHLRLKYIPRYFHRRRRLLAGLKTVDYFCIMRDTIWGDMYVFWIHGLIWFTKSRRRGWAYIDNELDVWGTYGRMDDIVGWFKRGNGNFLELIYLELKIFIFIFKAK